MSDWNQRIVDEFRANGGDVRTNGFGKRRDRAGASDPAPGRRA